MGGHYTEIKDIFNIFFFFFILVVSIYKNMGKWFGLIALIPGLAMVFLDQSILPVALPTMQKELGASETSLQWCINAYLLTIAVFVLLGGKFSDRVGHRRTLLIGISLFSVSSILCGVSPNVYFLIAARALQGTGAALMFPAQTALLAVLFPPKERGRAMGLNVSMGSFFLIMGPLIGGYCTEHFSWRLIFWINIPIAIVGFILCLRFLPRTKTVHSLIDLKGFIYFAISCSSAIIAFMQGSDWGWLSYKVDGLFAISLFSFFLLLRREKKAHHPFLDLTLFKNPVFTSINISISIVQFMLMVGVFRVIYFQNVLGYSPSEAGFITFATCIPLLFMSPIGGYLSDKLTPKLPIAIGFLLIISSFFWLGFNSDPSVTVLFLALGAYGLGVPLIFTPSYSFAMSTVKPSKRGVAFGMIATLRNFSATLGIAVIGLFMGGGEEKQIQMIRFSTAHFALGFLLIFAFAVTFILFHRKSTHHLPEAPAEGWD